MSSVVWLFVLCLSFQAVVGPTSAQEEEPAPLNETDSFPPAEAIATNSLPPVPPTNAVPEEPAISAEKAWRSFLLIQGRLDEALLAIERNRRENQTQASSNQDRLKEGLQSIEQVLQTQQEREIEALRESNRNMLIVAGAFAGVGFLAMFLTSLFHFRSMNKLSGIASGLPMTGGYGPAMLDLEEERLLSAQAGTRAPGQRLLNAIERLEKRVHELEHSAHAAPATGSSETDSPALDEAVDAEAPLSDEVSVLLGKGQVLLNLGQAGEALTCFEQALQCQPDHAEAWLKKGSALEKLNRLDDAIACYDRAIEVNHDMTLAYLYKGGLFNRMERYDEALACYEQALKTQQGSETAQVS